jgi:hypothetical protein
MMERTQLPLLIPLMLLWPLQVVDAASPRPSAVQSL